MERGSEWTRKELRVGARLKELREASGHTQQRIAELLGVSRPTIAQIETGRRRVTAAELVVLSRFFGVPPESFVEEGVPLCPEQKYRAGAAAGKEGGPAAAALYRNAEGALLETLEDDAKEELERVFAAVSLLRKLERLTAGTSSATEKSLLPEYPLRLSTKWHAIEGGEKLAREERNRLGAGNDALPDPALLLQGRGIAVAAVELDRNISGFSLHDETTVGALIVTNASEPADRQRFSIAHEYCHLLADRKLGNSTLSTSSDEELRKLAEVRANAFAAAFLMPLEGVTRFLALLGKGSNPKSAVPSARGSEAVVGRRCITAEEHMVRMHDVILLASHFGVSRTMAIHRLYNLRLISQTRRDELLDETYMEWADELESFLESPHESRPRNVGAVLRAFPEGSAAEAPAGRGGDREGREYAARLNSRLLGRLAALLLEAYDRGLRTKEEVERLAAEHGLLEGLAHLLDVRKAQRRRRG